jgi:hypothetical protein
MHLKRILIGTAVLCIASAGIHPFGAVNREDSNRALLPQRASMPKQCQCWYGLVKPVIRSGPCGLGTAMSRLFHG